MHHRPITSGQPLTSADIRAQVDGLGERQAQNVSRYNLRPNQPLTREQCDDLANGKGRTVGPFFSATDKQISNALWLMFGGAK